MLHDLPKRVRSRLRLVRAHWKRRRSKARFIVITGSSAKTTTTSLLTNILATTYKVRSQIEANRLENALEVLNRLDGTEDFVVVETGTGQPGDLKVLMELLKPDISIVTMVAVEHYSAFRGIEAVEKEKSEVVRALGRAGIAVLNVDDARVNAMAEQTSARVVTFGGNGSDYEIRQMQLSKDGFLTLTLARAGLLVTLPTQLVGMHNALAVTAASTCALTLGVPETAVVDAVGRFQPIAGRMSRHVVPDGTVFLVDSVKAPGHSIGLPLETLRAIEAPRKRFVLGQISDYPGAANKRYREAYTVARAVADEVIFVGPHGHYARPTAEDIAGNHYFSFQSVEDAAHHIKKTAIPDEVIVLKSSRNLHLERIMLSFSADVRCWINQCGSKVGCWQCSLYRVPFSEHGGDAKLYKRRKRHKR